MSRHDTADLLDALPDSARRALLDFCDASAGGAKRAGQLEDEFLAHLEDLKQIQAAARK